MLTVTRARSASLSASVTVPGRPVDDVVEGGRHAQAAQAGVVPECSLQVVRAVVLADQWGAQRRCRPGIVVGSVRSRLVGDEPGLDDNPRRRADRLDLVQDGGDRPLDERHEPGGADAHGLPGGRRPLDGAPQDAGPQVEDTLVARQRPVPDVERLVVDQQAHELAVRRVDDRLALLGIPVARLGVGQRQRLEEPVQVRARDRVGFALVEVPAQPDVTVRQRKDRLGLGEQIQAELAAPRPPTGRW